MPKFKKPTRNPDVAIQLPSSPDEEIKVDVWFKELIFILKIRDKNRKRFDTLDRGYLDRVSHLNRLTSTCESEWFFCWEDCTCDPHWMDDLNKLYSMNGINKLEAEDLEQKIEKAYQNWLFQEELERTLKS